MVWSRDMTYSAFAKIGTQTIKCLPGGVSKEEAQKQADGINDHFTQFPGGTQSIMVWIEPD